MMSILKHPPILIDLGHVGERGLPANGEAWFQRELELCREWGFRMKIEEGRVRLEFDQDALVPYWIQKESPTIAWDFLRVNGFLRLDSTNREACAMALQGAPHGTLVYAEEQTEGKGRRGRTWFSPPRSGIYCSLILRPTQPRRFWPVLTHVACVSLIETLKIMGANGMLPRPLPIDLKWPNDVLLDGKKCAGILLETLPVEGQGAAAIVGIGINVHPGSVPPELAAEAACLDEIAGVYVPRRQLLVRLLHQFQLCYRMFERGRHADILERWKEFSSMWQGVAVTIREEARVRTAVTCGLDEIGALRVRTEDGTVETILAGDVSVRRE